VNDIKDLFEPLVAIHEEIRRRVVDACERQSIEALSAVASDDAGDTIFAVDRISESVLIDLVESEIASRVPIVLVAEGIENGAVILPRDAKDSDVVWRIIADPIDGTRGLMSQKRSGWILTGVARDRGPETCLSDIEFAIQTEIPLVKQHLSDMLWAFRGEGAKAARFDRLKDTRTDLLLRPSQASTIEQGFSTISRFFPGGREVLAAIDDEIAEAALGAPKADKAQCFEDQYISSGGQLYELMAGHDRFIADLRPLLNSSGICSHPYDLCTELIARELGVIVTKVDGAPLDAPLDLESNVAWTGYANDKIRRQVEPHLQEALGKRGLL
jgi:fructose-1,6-bisphosphatase/inositol monophosphatase family enzyme